MPPQAPPLVVDLDGTFLKSDSFAEMLLVFFRQSPGTRFRVLQMWVSIGKAASKEIIAERVALDWSSLPVEPAVSDAIRLARKNGRHVVLATASNEKVARAIAEYHAVFDEVLASNGHRNLKGKNKSVALVEKFGAQGFDYIGNDSADIPVIAKARKGFLITPSSVLLRRALAVNPATESLGVKKRKAIAWARAVRPHQWAKNLLILLPAIGAQKLSPEIAWQLAAAIAIFSVLASSVYLLNDVLDIQDDRQHPTKKLRPFAAGDLQLSQGLGTAVLLGVGSLVVAFILVGWAFAGVLALYASIATAYSVGLKRVQLVDVFSLTILYSLRILAGGVVAGVALSPWLMSFTFFLFLSLALVKRFVELANSVGNASGLVAGRGYRLSDATPVMVFGIVAGFTAAVVLALYIDDQDVGGLYQRPEVLWLAVPLFSFWITRFWLLAHRKEVDDDPVKFAITDWPSIVFGVIIAVAWAVAA